MYGTVREQLTDTLDEIREAGLYKSERLAFSATFVPTPTRRAASR